MTKASDTAADPTAYYQQRINVLNSVVDELQRQDKRCSQIRGTAFLIAVGMILGGFLRESSPLIYLGVVAMGGFVAFIYYHDLIQHRLSISTARRNINRQQLARIHRDWIKLPASTQHPMAAIDKAKSTLTGTLPATRLDDGVACDLDLFGPASLWQLTNKAYTAFGQRIFHDWLLTPAAPNEIQQRQAAVKRLAPMEEFREHLSLHGRMLASNQTDPAAFVRWAEEGPKWLIRRSWMKWLTRFLAALMSLLLGLTVLRIEWMLAVFGLLLVNIVVNAVWTGSIHELFNRISAGNYDMVHYTALFKSVDSLPTDVERLAVLKNQMAQGASFDEAFSQLQRLVRLSNGRKSRMWVIPWMIAQIFFFWDFHILERLESWQARYGSNVAQWFDAVGNLEALASLAMLAHDEPEWAFPSVAASQEVVAAKDLGHPLLGRESCVRNDASVGPTKTFLLVTGSNMSGKSTLLRSIGVNTVLALAGGPVCASEFCLPPVELATSMRITDSLSSGVSFFMAELKRLKTIVDRAREITKQHSPPMLYLLDEILQGTNTSERHVAVTRVIGHLLDCHTLGAVSTHDLELASAKELTSRCQLVHLRETIKTDSQGDTMTFDYVVRPGVTPTTNALKLLEMVGLGKS